MARDKERKPNLLVFPLQFSCFLSGFLLYYLQGDNMRIGSIVDAAELCHRSKAWVYNKICQGKFPNDAIVMSGLIDLDKLEKHLLDGYFRKNKGGISNDCSDHGRFSTNIDMPTSYSSNVAQDITVIGPEETPRYHSTGQ